MGEYHKRQSMFDKPWAESTVEEKLEKIKEELTQLGYMSHSLNSLTSDVSKLKNHLHADGKVVIPVNDNSLGLARATLGVSRRNNLA